MPEIPKNLRDAMRPELRRRIVTTPTEGLPVYRGDDEVARKIELDGALWDDAELETAAQRLRHSLPIPVPLRCVPESGTEVEYEGDRWEVAQYVIDPNVGVLLNLVWHNHDAGTSGDDLAECVPLTDIRPIEEKEGA